MRTVLGGIASVVGCESVRKMLQKAQFHAKVFVVCGSGSRCGRSRRSQRDEFARKIVVVIVVARTAGRIQLQHLQESVCNDAQTAGAFNRAFVSWLRRSWLHMLHLFVGVYVGQRFASAHERTWSQFTAIRLQFVHREILLPHRTGEPPDRPRAWAGTNASGSSVAIECPSIIPSEPNELTADCRVENVNR